MNKHLLSIFLYETVINFIITMIIIIIIVGENDEEPMDLRGLEEGEG